jgi:hypothetical protein
MAMVVSRMFYGIVAAFALWVGASSYFDPALVVNAIPWPAPPLHARFIGALNLSVVVMCVWTAVSPSRDAARHLPILIAVWSGVICVASFLHLETYHYGEAPIWIWIVAYVAFPVVAGFLAFNMGRGDVGKTTQLLPVWQKTYLWLQGAILVLLGAVLFFAPDLAAALWPWKINSTLAQVYAGPFLAYGLVSFLVSRGGYHQAMVPMTGLLVFVILALIASVLHRALFSVDAVSGWLWFAALGAAAVSLGAFLLTGFRLRRAE